MDQISNNSKVRWMAAISFIRWRTRHRTGQCLHHVHKELRVSGIRFEDRTRSTWIDCYRLLYIVISNTRREKKPASQEAGRGFATDMWPTLFDAEAHSSCSSCFSPGGEVLKFPSSPWGVDIHKFHFVCRQTTAQILSPLLVRSVNVTCKHWKTNCPLVCVNVVFFNSVPLWSPSQNCSRDEHTPESSFHNELHLCVQLIMCNVIFDQSDSLTCSSPSVQEGALFHSFEEVTETFPFFSYLWYF